MAEAKKPVAVAKKTEEAKTIAATETAKKATVKKVAAKKEAAPKAAAKKEAAPKAAAKKEAAPKAAAKKAADVTVKVQFNGKEVDMNELKARVAKEAGNGAVAYFNVNDSKVYCTVNGEPKVDFEV
ncbi:MAG: DUF6465 family protein [Lachnospiraceae bacterium]|nr:DUF6465 family protein [Lachnospiraceae bacterium]